MTISQTESCTLRPITVEDASALTQMSLTNEKYRSILGVEYGENRKLANAYASNRGMYPLANVIVNSDSIVGVLILADAGKKALDVHLMMNDDAPDKAYEEVLTETVKECRKNGFKKIYVAPPKGGKDVFGGKKKYAEAFLAFVGTEEFPEYELKL